MHMAWAGLVDEDAACVRPVASHGAVDAYLDALDFSIPPLSQAQETLAAIAVRQKAQQVVNDIDGYAIPHIWREQALRRGYRVPAALPFIPGTRGTAVTVLLAPLRTLSDVTPLKPPPHLL